MNSNNLKSSLQIYIEERKIIDTNSSIEIYKKWSELTELLSKDLSETIVLLESSTKEEIEWISEVMEEVSENLDSKEYIDTLKRVNLKYPECNLDSIIEISIKHMKTKYDA